MTFLVADRVKETSTTTGTGDLDLDGAAFGFQTFVAGIGDTNETHYAIIADNGDWETGIGTVTDASPDTLSRDIVLDNSLGTTANINFAAGSKTVICIGAAAKVKTAYAHYARLTNFTISNNSTTGIDFDEASAEVESNNNPVTHNHLSNPQRFTFQDEFIGQVIVAQLDIRWANNTVGDRLHIIIQYDSVGSLKKSCQISHDANGHSTQAPAYSYSLPCLVAEGDYVEFFAYQNSGGNLDLLGTGTGIHTKVYFYGR